MLKRKSVQQRVWVVTLRLARKIGRAAGLSVPQVIHRAIEQEYIRNMPKKGEQ